MGLKEEKYGPWEKFQGAPTQRKFLEYGILAGNELLRGWASACLECYIQKVPFLHPSFIRQVLTEWPLWARLVLSTWETSEQDSQDFHSNGGRDSSEQVIKSKNKATF